MAWLWLTLGAQFLFSVGVHVDKVLLDRYFRGRTPGVLILFSALFALVVLPAILAIHASVLDISPAHVAIVLVGGFLNITGVVLSLYAIQEEEASVVAPLFQMIPFFTYLLAFVVLGETMSVLQVVAGFLIVAGAVLLTLDLRDRRVAFKRRVFLRMALASILLATNAVLFKLVAIEEDFWTTTFWSYVSLALVGVGLFGLVGGWRRQFLQVLRTNRAPVIAVNLGNEVLAVVGYVMITYATLLVPVALVSVMSGFQPLMVFLLGILLTRLAPRLAKEDLSRRAVLQKLVAMALLFAGVALIHT